MEPERFWKKPEGGLRLVVAIDHGLSFPRMSGLEAPLDIASTVAGNSRVDGLIASYGIYRQTQRLGIDLADKTRFVLADYVCLADTSAGEVLTQREMIIEPEDALKLDVHCYKMFLNIYDDSRELYRNCRDMERVVTFGANHGIATLAEIMFFGNDAYNSLGQQTEELMRGCRIAMELGADILKIPVVSDLSVIDEIAAQIKLPIYMLGGVKSSNPEEFIKGLKEVCKHKIDGFMFGRNIWQAADINKSIEDIAGIGIVRK